MLTEISCELFKIGEQIRPPVRFHKGLNIILGGEAGANSIGKSTMLLIIDFAFGGDAYVKSDAVRELDNHNIHFTFEFDGKPYYFIRHTASPGDIFQLSENGNIIASLKRDEYVNWLSNRYEIDFAGVKFRNTISRFFRIYGKNNYNELRPLQMRGGTESQESAIHVLVTLFNQYESVLAFEEQLQLAEDKIAAFKSARKYQFIPSAVDGLKKYEENISIMVATDDVILIALLERILSTGFISSKVNPAEIAGAATDFESLSIDDKKRFILELLDKNMLYVNLCDLDDEEYAIGDADKSFTRSFYGMEGK